MIIDKKRDFRPRSNIKFHDDRKNKIRIGSSTTPSNTFVLKREKI